jgi:putative transposase
MPDVHRIRRSIRLTGYDYSQPGAYFVTIVTNGRECIFGQIFDGQIVLYDAGWIVDKSWRDLPKRYPGIHLEAFVVMPNHVHGVFTLMDNSRKVSEIIRGFKSVSARKINLIRNSTGQPVWQRNYYEHIVRDEAEFQKIVNYIETNPLNWEKDHENQLSY